MKVLISWFIHYLQQSQHACYGANWSHHDFIQLWYTDPNLKVF